MTRRATLAGLFLLVFAPTSRAQDATGTTQDRHGPTIKEAYKNHFFIGMAGDLPGNYSAQELSLVKENFGFVTPENCMKPAPIHPSENLWRFERPDALVKWCVDNNRAIHGHTLVWHAQTNDWFFRDGDKAPVTQRMRDHISTLVGRYKGKIRSWDVVNEAISDRGNAQTAQTENLRTSPWLQAMGPKYLTLAFQFAHQSDPDATLYYNDYGIEAGPKHASSLVLLKRLIREGAPIHGVGIQGHWSTARIPYDALDKAISDYASLGLKVSITELDVTIRGASGGQFGPGFGGRRFGRGEPPSPQDFQAQADAYARLFAIFIKHKHAVERVTFWGLSDRRTWRFGQHPLIFDSNNQRKPAYAAIVEAVLNPGDSGNRARNPILWADVPDLAAIRVGETYYMSSTTMHLSPGLPIMKSKDLVNWQIVSYAYNTLGDNDALTLQHGKNAYGAGSWASSLRHHDGSFYATTFSSTTGKTHVYRTKDIEKGPWIENSFRPALHDHTLFFDDDGRVYMIYGGGDLRLLELTADVTGIQPGGVDQVVIPNASRVAGPNIGLPSEGSQLFKVNGKYYLFNITWPRGGMRTVLVHRADKITGPYEGRVALQDKGVAQGGLIDTPQGDWYAYLFRDYGAVGRIPYLVPVKWEDRWPVLGVDGKVPDTLSLPASRGPIPGLIASDEFDRRPGEPALPLAWQWNHNPADNGWSLAERPGFLRLTTGRTDADFLSARNTLTQRTFGPACSGTVGLDVSNMKDGDFAGLGALQKRYGLAGVKLGGNAKSIVMVSAEQGSPVEVESVPLTQDVVYLKVECDFQDRADTARFFYSLDGQQWTAIGKPLRMTYTLPHFMGYRFALFNYATKTAGGFADFDFFRVSDKIADSAFRMSKWHKVTLTLDGPWARESDDDANPFSDNWPMTWADDDWLYTADGDGNGFEPRLKEKLSLGLARVRGNPPEVVAENLRAPTLEQKGDGARGKKASGLLMVDGVLYLWARNAGNAQLAWSADHGATWTWADWKLTTSFGCPTFLNFGRNYEGARDQFVYVYSQDADSAYQRADRMVLARAPKHRQREQSAYEFFQELDSQGRPVWTKDVTQRGAVLTSRGRCYRSSVSYNAGLRRYLWVQTGLGEDTRFAGGLAIYDAPEPWGPWTTVFATDAWDVGPGETASFPTKWISPNGCTLYLADRQAKHFTLILEAMYDGHGANGWQAVDARSLAWRSWLSGTKGYTYGAGDTPPKCPQGSGGVWKCVTDRDKPDFWEKAIAWESSRQMQYLHDFLAAIEGWKLEPAHELIRNQPDDITRRMVLAKVAGRDFAVAYLPDNEAIEVNLSAFSAPVTARWFDPVRGRSSPVTGRISNQGDRCFAPPAKGDWVLVIERAAEGVGSPKTQSK